jgi:outer membrane protein OmpA-like peptidoglycan-associated protein
MRDPSEDRREVDGARRLMEESRPELGGCPPCRSYDEKENPHMMSGQNPTRSARGRRQGAPLLMAFGLSLAACGGQIPFSGTAQVAGDPPAAPKKASRVEVRDNKIEIHEKIQFELAKATIKPESYSLLDEIVSVIKAAPHIKKISIEGHASADGDAAFNKRLSSDRAKSVRAYLVEHGIPEGTLVATGFGVEKPIASNDTEEGREKNRRVEFNIVEQDVTKKKVEIDDSGKEKVLEESTDAAASESPSGLSKPKK